MEIAITATITGKDKFRGETITKVTPNNKGFTVSDAVNGAIIKPQIVQYLKINWPS